MAVQRLTGSHPKRKPTTSDGSGCALPGRRLAHDTGRMDIPKLILHPEHPQPIGRAG